MKTLNDLKNEVYNFISIQKSKGIIFKNPEKISDYIHIYMESKGITSIYAYEIPSEEDEYDVTLEKFFNDARNNVDAIQVVLEMLDFLIWIKVKYANNELVLESRKYIKRQALEFIPFINRIISNDTINSIDKMQILLFSYCSLLEYTKNIIQEEVLLIIFKKHNDAPEIDKKRHITMGDFKFIISINKKSTLFNKLIDAELRNKIYHGTYLHKSNGVSFQSGEGKWKDISLNELNIKISTLGKALQLFILLYLRMFRASEELSTKP